MSEKRRFVVVGTGVRGTGMWVRPMVTDYADRVEAVGLFDINPERARAANRLLGADIPVYESLDEMLAKARPDSMIVASTDATHAEYVTKGLQSGLNVYCEKPLCTTIDQVKAIRAAARDSEREALVTHNMRCVPSAAQMKREIDGGRIGEIRHVLFTETLDRYHGADYFRRWHRRFVNGGGLLLQKASHHFDFINWMVGRKPATVSAHGRLLFYGKNGPFHGERCTGCRHAQECPLYADVFKNQYLDDLYRKVENVDGYFRDRCVFGEEIDIDDTMNATLMYENGVMVSYSLIAYASHESLHCAVEGTEGRLEWTARFGTAWAVGHKESESTLAQSGSDIDRIQSCNPEHQVTDITPSTAEGGHGGADPVLMDFVFSDEPPADPLGQRAPLEDGIQAVLVGIAANESIRRDGIPVQVQV